MKAGLNYSRDTPETIKGMLDLEKYLHDSGLERPPYELVNIKTS